MRIFTSLLYVTALQLKTWITSINDKLWEITFEEQV